MKAAHIGLAITSEEYDQFIGLIVGVLTGAGVSEDYIGTCFAPALVDPAFKADFLKPEAVTCPINVCETYGAAVPAVVGALVDAAAADPAFASDFAALVAEGPAAVDAFKASLTAFVSDAFACTTGAYTGPDMATAHAGLDISRGEYYDFVARLTVNVLNSFMVPADHINLCFAPALLGDDLVNSMVHK